MENETSVQSTGMILLRMVSFTSATRSLAERLMRESGHQVACLVDERGGSVDVTPFQKVALTVPACRSLGLHCPPDMAWRCGDYGLYLARLQYPTASHFWLFEHDVRISGLNLSDFFTFFEAHGTVDLIAPQYRRVDGHWYWAHSIPGRNVTIYRCLFPLVRLTAKAIDRLLARRRRMSRSLVSRVSWPNDEITVATTLSNDGSVCHDLNGLGRTVYTDETFSFFTPFDGDTIDLNSSDGMVYHPVLFGEDYKLKITRLQKKETREERLRRRTAKVLNSWAKW